MIIIAKPRILVSKIWDIGEYHKDGLFRLMTYVMRVDYENEVYLQNTVTGQLVKLSSKEADLMELLPSHYSPVMDALIKGCFIVPEEFDEHQKVVIIRELLRKIKVSKTGSSINAFIILPTTACNARCWYCFEHGIKPVSMSEQTADDVVEFIANNAKGQKVLLKWFGGEPTLAITRIDQISKGLKEKGVSFTSEMITNGYLFNETIIERADELWNLNSVRISIDGSEKNYNRIKSYVDPEDNPFQRVMRNTGLFIRKGIKVELRLNFDINNYADFYELLALLEPQFRNNQLLQLYVHQIDNQARENGIKEFASIERWYNDKIFELNNLSRTKGLLSEKNELPCLNFSHCYASDSSAITITPEGNLVNCPERIQPDNFVGSIKRGIVNHELSESWRRIADYDRCQKCVLFPTCVKVERCSGRDKCFWKKDRISRYKEAIIRTIHNHL